MAAAGGNGPAEPDMALVAELLENITRAPPAIGARKILVEHYISLGWLDAAADYAKELRSLAPHDPDVARYLETLSETPKPPVPTPTSSPEKAGASATVDKLLSKPGRRPGSPSFLRLNGKLDGARQHLARHYNALRTPTNSFLVDILHRRSPKKKHKAPVSKDTETPSTITEGPSPGTLPKPDPSASAESVARAMRKKPEQATDVAILDLEATMKWLRDPHTHPFGTDDDTVRECLVKRMTALESAHPERLKSHPSIRSEERRVGKECPV